eukprot:jgi/Undpi1/6163/HiC_scaffold_20.g08647.m1
MLGLESSSALSWNWRISLFPRLWSAVVLLLLSYSPRRGESFVQTRGSIAGLGRGIYGLGRARVSTLPLRKPQGGGLRMDARSCAPEITDDDFETEVLNEDRPVLVFFRAPWCGPCRMVGPIVDEVIADHGGKLKVLELCTDENPKTVAEFKIRNIPTLMLFNERKSVLTVVGAVPKSALVSSIKKHMDL